ncbi:MAG: type II toxin-antitoxin system VapC family toxin [Actinomycetota bacterium]
MSGRAAIDSNAYVALCTGDVQVASMIGSLQSVCLPVVVLGELLYGAGASSRTAENLRKVREFAQKCALLDINADVAERYATLKLELRAAGKPIPDNDLWIAALCLEAGIPLITRDCHFAHLTTLSICSW